MGSAICGFAPVVAKAMNGSALIADLILKCIGAAAGAALALVFVPPRTYRGFIRRLVASLMAGVIFASYVRGWAGFSMDWEGTIASACLTAFVAWWMMSAILTLIRAGKFTPGDP